MLARVCGRFTLTTPSYDDLADALGAAPDPGGSVAYRPRYNIAPTDLSWVLRNRPPGAARARVRELVAARWGFVPHDASTKRQFGMPINARAESVRAWSLFRGAFATQRCAVPSTGFFEWIKEGKAKHPVWFKPEARELLLFAGLWDDWIDPTTGEALRSFVVITTRANELVAKVHDRMPVILEDDSALEAWLGDDPTAAATTLRPAGAGVLRAVPVSDRVNSVKNDDPACLAPPAREPAAPLTLLDVGEAAPRKGRARR
ncbi:MAG: SOS response-associated peptidase [Polyangiaceae bacterium]